MEPSIYQIDSLPKRVRLSFPALTLGAGQITENLSFSENVNAAADLVVGTAGAAQLSFELINLNQLVTDAQIQEEFFYQQGVQTGGQSLLSLYQAIRARLLLPAGQLAYAAEGRQLSIWDCAGAVPVRLGTQTLAQPALCLFLTGGRLYCGHAQAPYLSVYCIAGSSLTAQVAPTLTPYQTGQIQQFNRSARVFCDAPPLLREYQPVLRSAQVQDYREHTFTYTPVGYFTAAEPVRKNDNLIQLSCYDRMLKFQTTAVDAFLEGLHYPVSLKELLAQLCDFVGVPLATKSFFNEAYLVQRNLRAKNLSARQLLEWIAQLACCFAQIDGQGRVLLRWYQQKDYTIQADYREVEIGEYATQKIDRLQIRTTENDVGVTVGTGQNQYVIENNGLLYAEQDAQLRPIAQKIFDRIKEISYTPYRIKTKGNYLLRAGDLIQIQTAKGARLQALIMSRQMSGVNALVDTYQAVGNRRRNAQSSQVNQNIQQLRGSVHELVVDVEKLDSTITRYQQQTDRTLQTQQSQITQNANSIKTKVSQTVYDANMRAVDEHFSSLEQTASGLSVQIGEQGRAITSLKLSTKGLDLAVDNNRLIFDENGLSIYNGGIHIYGGGSEILSVGADDKLNLVCSRAQIDTLQTDNIESSGGTVRLYGRLDVDKIYINENLSGEFEINVKENIPTMQTNKMRVLVGGEVRDGEFLPEYDVISYYTPDWE
ncbi:MAG: hypothetical protein HFG20_05720 [Anaerotruncus sp.]|nr:hypothetical protein [Anaerotruncus sp.]